MEYFPGREIPVFTSGNYRHWYFPSNPDMYYFHIRIDFFCAKVFAASCIHHTGWATQSCQLPILATCRFYKKLSAIAKKVRGSWEVKGVLISNYDCFYFWCLQVNRKTLHGEIGYLAKLGRQPVVKNVSAPILLTTYCMLSRTLSPI